MCTLEKRMREVIDCVFCALCMVFLGRAVIWHRQDCNRQSMQRVQITWSIGTALCQNARTQIWFSKQTFSWFQVVSNNKRPPGINSKASDCFSRICLYYSMNLSNVSASNWCLNCLKLWLLFFPWVSHGKSTDCRKLPYSNKFDIIF